MKNQATDAIRSTMDIPSTSRWYVVFLGARFQTRNAAVDDPRIEANAVNLGAIATAFCWARVDILLELLPTWVARNNTYTAIGYCNEVMQRGYATRLLQCDVPLVVKIMWVEEYCTVVFKCHSCPQYWELVGVQGIDEILMMLLMTFSFGLSQ